VNAYRLIEHTADTGIEVTAPDARTLFIEAGQALYDLLAMAEGPCDGLVYEITLDGADWTDLMINWLRELLYLYNGRELLGREINITQLNPRQIAARLLCDRLDSRRHVSGQEIKAVTYHQARVAADAKGWQARVIFDL
jgi:SHS2 domain-containing protein